MRRLTPALGRHRRPLLAVVVATALGLGACGETSGDDGAGATEPCGAEDGTTVVVEIPDFTFQPDPVTVDRCDDVVWLNAHDQAHTSTGDGEQRWSTGNLAPGDRSEPVSFEEAGAHTYLCALHPFMTGTVEVT